MPTKSKKKGILEGDQPQNAVKQAVQRRNMMHLGGGEVNRKKRETKTGKSVPKQTRQKKCIGGNPLRKGLQQKKKKKTSRRKVGQKRKTNCFTKGKDQ